ncbi:MAG: hypothetical protein JKY33_05975 [Bacteroidia bacterium]|nr:hypothetical protein [Bacteroidia bacterium]
MTSINKILFIFKIVLVVLFCMTLSLLYVNASSLSNEIQEYQMDEELNTTSVKGNKFFGYKK